MSIPWFPPGKLSPPAAPAGAVERAASLAPSPLVLLQAGAGYGKTTLMAELARRAAADGALAWLALDADDVDAGAFFKALGAAVAACVPPLGAELAALADREAPDPRRLWHHFFREAAAYGLPALVIAIDDAHHLAEDQAGILRALAPLLERSPPGMRLMFASRTRLPLPAARLEARGIARVLGPAELAFTPAELGAFFAARAPRDGVPPSWYAAAAAIEGWPLGLELVVRARTLPGDAAPGSSALAAYVAEELVGEQPAEVRRFMRDAALLEAFDGPLCEAALGAAEADGTLAALEAAHLIIRLDDGTFRFPAHLAGYLAEVARRELTSAERSLLLGRAGAFERSRGRLERAIAHWVAAGGWERVAAEGTPHFAALSLRGRHGLVRGWLADVPAAVEETLPAIALWRGNVRAAAGDYASAEASYARARAAWEAAGNQPGVLKATVRRASMAALRGEDEALAAELARAATLLEGAAAEDRAEYHLLHALQAELGGNTEAMREHNEAALTVPADGNVEVAACHTTALTNLFTHALLLGELPRARAAIDRAAELAASWQFRSEGLFARFMRAYLDLLVGEPEAAWGFLRDLPAHWRDLLGWQDRAIALVALACGHMAREEWRQAEDALHESIAAFDAAGQAEGRLVPLEHLLWLMVRRGRWSRALELAAGAERGESVQASALAIPVARARIGAGEATEAARTLAPLIARLEAQGARLHEARARLVHAMALAATGDMAGATAARRKAETLIDAHDMGFLRREDPALWSALAPASGEPAAAPAGPPAVQDVTPPLRIHMLGGLTVWRGDERIASWPRRRAKVILAALALRPSGLRLVSLAELLELEEDGSRATLYADISFLRRALEPSLPKRGDSAYLINEGERYMLIPERIAFVDTAAFDAAIAAGDATRAAAEEDAVPHYEEAVALYQGELLDDGAASRHFERERRYYKERALAAALWLAAHYGARDQDRLADRALERALAIGPADEEVYMALMRHHHVRRRFDRVRHAYWDCRRALKTRLGIRPSADFDAAYRALTQAG